MSKMSISTEKTNLLQYLCQRSRVLIIGDVVLEKFVHTSIKQISSEFAIPVFVEDSVSYRVGGCGNVALNLQKLGIEVRLMAPVDPQGQIYELLVKNGISTEAFLRCSRHDVLRTRYICSGYQCYSVDSSSILEKPLPLESLTKQILTYLAENTAEFDCLVISEFEGSLLNEEIVQSIIQSARKLSVPVLVDTRSGQYQKYHGATLMKLNNIEDTHLSRECLVTDDDSMLCALQQFRKQLQVEGCVLNLPKDGLAFCQEDGLMKVVRKKGKSTANSTGREDIILACLAFGSAKRLSLWESCELANHAAQSIIVPQESSPLDLVEVLKHYSKVVTNPQQECFLGDVLRKGQLKIVFMSGCFDMMHRGHINILRRAKERGDILVVGLNSDSSVKSNKGEQRPICSQEDRLEVLKCIHYCDFIIVFDKKSPARILDTLQPHLLVKGDDHPESHVRVMFPQMQNKLAILPRTPGISTTDLICKLTQ